ncbi:hypothetical protein MAR_027177, partial [Mya arenaria]
KCVKRILQQWPALCSYFESHEEGEKLGRVQRTKETLTDPLDVAHLFFLGSHHSLDDKFQHYLPGWRPHGWPPSHLDAAPDEKPPGKVCLHTGHCSCKRCDILGLKTRQNLQENEETLPPGTSAKFFRLFYTSLASSLLKKFPFNDDILKTLSYLNPETREKTSAEA